MSNVADARTAHRARGALAPAVFSDASAGVTVVDVSDWAKAVDMTRLAAMGDPILVCFGTHHPGRCALSRTRFKVDGPHGVLFSTVAGRPADTRFVDRFRELVRPKTPVRNSPRPAAMAALKETKER